MVEGPGEGERIGYTRCRLHALRSLHVLQQTHRQTAAVVARSSAAERITRGADDVISAETSRICN